MSSVISNLLSVSSDGTVELTNGRKYSGEVNVAKQPHGNGTEYYEVSAGSFLSRVLAISVTRVGEISPFWHNFRGFISYLAIFYPTLAKML